MSATSWPLPPIYPVLSDIDVHVWSVGLDQPNDRAARLAALLSADEIERSRRFFFARDKIGYTVAHGVLRVILGHYLSLSPSQVQFRYSSRGKPALAPTMGDPALQFNLAHSHQLALFAFSRGRRIGVDVEYIRTLPNIPQLVATFFSNQENAEFNSLAQNRQEAFFISWTCKEAFLKATGNGLSQPLSECEISLVAEKSVRLLRVAGQQEEASRWSLQLLSPPLRLCSCFGRGGTRLAAQPMAVPG